MIDPVDPVDHIGLARRVTDSIAAAWPRWIDRSHLESAAMLALVEAAERHDPALGNFEAYATTCIRFAVRTAARNQDLLPDRRRRRVNGVRRAEDELTARLGRTPSPPEIAARLRVTVPAVQAAQRDGRRASTRSLDDVLDDGSDFTLADTIPADETVEDVVLHRERVAHLAGAIGALHPTHRAVIEGVLAGRSHADIAPQLGVSKSRVSQIYREALRLLRNALDHIDGGAPPRPTAGYPGVTERHARRVAAVARSASRTPYRPGGTPATNDTAHPGDRPHGICGCGPDADPEPIGACRRCGWLCLTHSWHNGRPDQLAS